MTSSRPLPPPEVPFTCRPNPTETIDGSTTRRAVRAVTLVVRVGALLSFRMRRQTTPASPTTGLAAAARRRSRVAVSVSPAPSRLRPFVASIIAGVEGTRFGCVVCPAHLTTVPGHCLARPSRPTAPVLVGQRRNVKSRRSLPPPPLDLRNCIDRPISRCG